MAKEPFFGIIYSPEYSNSLSYMGNRIRVSFFSFRGREALFLWDEETSLPFFLSSISFLGEKGKGFYPCVPVEKEEEEGFFLFSSVFVGRERGKEKGGWNHLSS